MPSIPQIAEAEYDADQRCVAVSDGTTIHPVHTSREAEMEASKETDRDEVGETRQADRPRRSEPASICSSFPSADPQLFALSQAFLFEGLALWFCWIWA
ncbi:hypothetical protein DPEC_G00308730 [Dallia pectoralis]|uniref:Uncharacterized protein n=1 Tax=Dallia pectoralis TaxID=75939 RepID=A0ACC2FES0_DALPE|nr:hypothetical protein DPEC_G00308730 [Dallia pectoralis]